MRSLSRRSVLRRMAFSVLVLFGSLCAVSSAGAERSAEELLEEAVGTYTLGLHDEERDSRLEAFRRAHRLFAAVAVREKGNADLYTNAGNAALQAEDLGAAVLAYRRALLISPGHSRALQNLDHARTLLPGWIPRPQPEGVLDNLFFWHRTISRELRSLLAAGAFWIGAALCAAAIRFRQTSLRNAAILPGLVWLALLGSVLLDPLQAQRDEAVVVVPEVVARAADSALAPSAFPQPLPSGVELRLLEERLPWLRVRLANGRDAWVTESAVVRVDPSR